MRQVVVCACIVAACAGARSDTALFALDDGQSLTVSPSGSAGWHYRPDLSYRPGGRAPSGAFVHLDFFTARAGHERDVEALAKEHVEIDRAAGVGHARDLFTADAGNAHVLVQLVRADSRAAYEREKAAAEKLRGPRIHALYERVTKVITAMRSVEGRAVDTTDYHTEAIRLPGATGLVTLDYFVFDRATGRLWVPAGNTARIDVIDGDTVRSIGDQATAQFELHGKHGLLGASSATLGDGVVWIGNRADRSICGYDARSLQRRGCLTIASPADGWGAAPDAVVYVPATKELWVSRGSPPLGIASSDRALAIIDVANPDAPHLHEPIPLDASAEGYAVDAARGIFYTNLEESAETIAIDVHSHSIIGRWHSGCAEPHGLALDTSRSLVFVACEDSVISLDTALGTVTGTLETGKGVDNIDYDAEHQLVLAAAEDSGTLTIARADTHGLALVATIATAPSTRGVVAGAGGTIFVADPRGGRILRITHR